MADFLAKYRRSKAKRQVSSTEINKEEFDSDTSLPDLDEPFPKKLKCANRNKSSPKSIAQNTQLHKDEQILQDTNQCDAVIPEVIILEDSDCDMDGDEKQSTQLDVVTIEDTQDSRAPSLRPPMISAELAAALFGKHLPYSEETVIDISISDEEDDQGVVFVLTLFNHLC